MIIKAITLVALISYACTSHAFDTIMLDDFETGVITVVNDTQADPRNRLLWNQYEGDFTKGPDPGDAAINTGPANVYSGSYSLNVNVTGGNIYLQLYPYNGTGWLNMQDYMPGYVDDKYNELHFWMYFPPGITKAGSGNKNVTFGTYIRATTGSLQNAEDGGGHFYHNYSIGTTGVWQKVIVDMHPDHERGANGNTEHDYIPYKTGEPGFNYFDTMTRFYFEVDGQLAGQYLPADFYVDRFEMVHNTDDENYEQVANITSAYIPGSNTVLIDWRRRKDEPGIVHELRYSFSDIHAAGWANATSFTGTTSVTARNDAYNGMAFTNTTVDMAANQSLYVAIKPVGSARFRQIVIPVAAATSGQCTWNGV